MTHLRRITLGGHHVSVDSDAAARFHGWTRDIRTNRLMAVVEVKSQRDAGRVIYVEPTDVTFDDFTDLS